MKVECVGEEESDKIGKAGPAKVPATNGLALTNGSPRISLPSTSSTPLRRKASAPLPGHHQPILVDCLICSDKATGKHYGSISCDGCKGFFRRTIRKKHNYLCRFSQNCIVDKNQRNSCRRCRFDKCLANGMRPEAVQQERDRIAATRCRRGSAVINGDGSSPASSRKRSASGENDDQRIEESPSSCGQMSSSSPAFCAEAAAIAERILLRLMEAERTLAQAAKRETALGQKAPRAKGQTATTGDVTDSMHHQLILLVEWAKQLEQFRRLSLRSRIALLRHFSGQHLVICAAFRSLLRSAEIDAVWLANDRYVPRDAPKIPDVNRVVARILDHLTVPMRHLRLEEREFVALKAVAFFDPMAKDVDLCSVADIEDTRRAILSAFEHQVLRISEHRHKMPLRLANLLLLLPPLMAIARDLVEEAQLAKLFGLANVDELMAELLLPEDAETRSYSRLRTSVTSSIVQSNVTSPTPPSTSPLQLLTHSPGGAGSATVPPPTPTTVPWILAAPTPIYSPAAAFLFAPPGTPAGVPQLLGRTAGGSATPPTAAVASSTSTASY